MTRRPNFLVFCIDPMQSYCLGCNGHPVAVIFRRGSLSRSAAWHELTTVSIERNCESVHPSVGQAFLPDHRHTEVGQECPTYLAKVQHLHPIAAAPVSITIAPWELT